MISALSDAFKDNALRVAAIRALGELGLEAKSAVGSIIASFKDNQDRNYRWATNDFLKKIQGK